MRIGNFGSLQAEIWEIRKTHAWRQKPCIAVAAAASIDRLDFLDPGLEVISAADEDDEYEDVRIEFERLCGYSVVYPLSLAASASCPSAYCILLPVQSLPSAQLQRGVDMRTNYTHPTDTDTTEKSGIKKGPPPHSPALPVLSEERTRKKRTSKKVGKKGGLGMGFTREGFLHPSGASDCYEKTGHLLWEWEEYEYEREREGMGKEIGDGRRRGVRDDVGEWERELSCVEARDV
jgi:hypothetical protein